VPDDVDLQRLHTHTNFLFSPLLLFSPLYPCLLPPRFSPSPSDAPSCMCRITSTYKGTLSSGLFLFPISPPAFLLLTSRPCLLFHHSLLSLRAQLVYLRVGGPTPSPAALSSLPPMYCSSTRPNVRTDQRNTCTHTHIDTHTHTHIQTQVAAEWNTRRRGGIEKGELLHYCSTVVPLLLHCGYTGVTLTLH
jgi:hypothetical protein